MKCVVTSGTLKHGVEKESRLYEIGDDVDVTYEEYATLQHMLKPIEAVMAEKQAKKILDKSIRKK